MKLALLVVLIIVTSCGNNKSGKCNSREKMRINCQVQYIPTYGYPYAVEMCNRTYEADRCY